MSMDQNCQGFSRISLVQKPKCTYGNTLSRYLHISKRFINTSLLLGVDRAQILMVPMRHIAIQGHYGR